MNVLTAHVGHAVIVESDQALLCKTCERDHGRLTRLLIRLGSETPVPHRWSVPDGPIADPKMVPAWALLRTRFPRKTP